MTTKKKILIVRGLKYQTHFNSDAISLCSKQKGYEFKLVFNSTDAIKILKSEKIDGIICDQNIMYDENNTIGYIIPDSESSSHIFSKKELEESIYMDTNADCVMLYALFIGIPVIKAPIKIFMYNKLSLKNNQNLEDKKTIIEQYMKNPSLEKVSIITRLFDNVNADFLDEPEKEDMTVFEVMFQTLKNMIK